MRATVRMALFMVGIGAIGGIGVLGGVSAGLAAPGGSTQQDKAGAEMLALPAQYWRGDRCERLRRACRDKDERGERGEGNCQRYREECGGTSYCERLRRACVYKEYRGEEGEGNCRRYRRECERY